MPKIVGSLLIALNRFSVGIMIEFIRLDFEFKFIESLELPIPTLYKVAFREDL